MDLSLSLQLHHIYHYILLYFLSSISQIKALENYIDNQLHKAAVKVTELLSAVEFVINSSKSKSQNIGLEDP